LPAKPESLNQGMYSCGKECPPARKFNIKPCKQAANDACQARMPFSRHSGRHKSVPANPKLFQSSIKFNDHIAIMKEFESKRKTAPHETGERKLDRGREVEQAKPFFYVANQ
jgi:hypothetical protein